MGYIIKNIGKINIASPKILTWVNTGQKINIAKRNKKKNKKTKTKKIKLKLLLIEGQEEGKKKKKEKEKMFLLSPSRCEDACEDWWWELGK